jgi:diguanylate cyclase (GGDEF)-like protein
MLNYTCLLARVRNWIRASLARRIALSASAVAVLASTLVGLLVVSLRPAATTTIALLGGAGTVVCVAVATLVIVDRLLSRSLAGLTQSLRAAEKGRWLKPIDTGRADEIGDLARAFERLSATVTDLSVSVIDKGRELEWARRELALKESLSLLFELTQTLDAETDLGSIPRRVCEVLGFEQMAVLLHDPATDGFVVRATHGMGGAALGISFPRDDVISGAVADTGEPLVIADTARDPRYSHFRGTHPVDGAFACVPMRVQGRLVGLFNVLRPGAASISPADVELLGSIASYAGLAIEHAQLRLRLRDLAVTDPLTGLANRRLLLERTQREIDRGRPLALLMLDLDHFKAINDELGHPKGDEALIAVARALTAATPGPGTVARYGGEEFCVLLPDCARAEALAVAEALRHAVRALAVGRPLTVSIGVAAFPDDAAGEGGLVAAADRALLAAKRAGRDRVTSSGSATPSGPARA